MIGGLWLSRTTREIVSDSRMTGLSHRYHYSVKQESKGKADAQVCLRFTPNRDREVAPPVPLHRDRNHIISHIAIICRFACFGAEQLRELERDRLRPAAASGSGGHRTAHVARYTR